MGFKTDLDCMEKVLVVKYAFYLLVIFLFFVHRGQTIQPFNLQFSAL